MQRIDLKTVVIAMLACGLSLCAQEMPDVAHPPGRGRIEPVFAKLQPGAEVQFRAIVEAPQFDFSHLARNVIWTVNEIPGGDSKVGTIDPTGRYHAPAVAPSPHEVHIRAEVAGLANHYLFATALVGAPEISYRLTNSWADPPAAHRLVYPHSIALDPDGNLLIADSDANRVFRFSPAGKFLTRIGCAASALPATASGAATPANQSPRLSPEIGYFGEEPRGCFSGPRVAIADSSGRVYVVDVAERRPMIQVFDRQGQFLYSFGRHGILPGELQRAHGMAFDSKGRLHVEDVENARVDTYEPGGKFVSAWGQEGTLPGDLNAPHGIYVDPNDEVFVIGYYGPTQKFSADGHFLRAFAFADPPDHAISFQSVSGDDWGDVYVPMRHEGLAKFSNTGDFLGWVVKGRAVQWAAEARDGTVYVLPARLSPAEPKPKATVEVYTEQ